jgi:hypothetical protein
MTLRQYLFVMTLSTLLCWGAWVFVLFNVDPYHSNFVGFLFFYLSIALTLFGTFALIIFAGRYIITKKYQTLHTSVKKSSRDSAMLSTICVALVLLYSLNLLNYWILGIFSTLVILIIILRFTLRRTP